MKTVRERGPVRAFIAIELPTPVKRLLGREIDRLRAALPASMRWVRPDSVHLTLKFLGAIPQEQVPAIVDSLRTACREVGPIRLRTGLLGCFPNLRHPRVLWMGVGGDTEALVALQGRVDSAVEPLGFAREGRPFVPHLTLARAKGRGAGPGQGVPEELLVGQPREEEAFVA
ncbi:MAG: RNA 2',3'-cyclic phosphodiesterase, partial [Dehalococcoidia bacterium]